MMKRLKLSIGGVALLIALCQASLFAAGITRISFGSSTPTNCVSGNLFVKTSATAGLYWCSTPGSPGTWTLIGGGGSGTVTTTGSPASGNLAKFSGSTSITNTDLTGDVTTSGTAATTIANDAVTYAKMQNVSATSRLICRKTAGSGDAEECTLSDALDFVGSAAQGDILYRGASSWARLGAGSSGQALVTNGAGANPSWGSISGGSGGGMVLLEQHTASSSATLDFTSCVTSTYDDYEFEFVRVQPATDNVHFGFRVSYDGGSTWQSAASSYFWLISRVLGNTTSAIVNDGSVGMTSTTNYIATNVDTTIGTSLAGVNGRLKMYAPGDAINHRFLSDVVSYDNSNLDSRTQMSSRNTGTSAVNAVQFLFSSGNLASGTIRCYGLAK
jgi:hypothetical protein